MDDEEVTPEEPTEPTAEATPGPEDLTAALTAELAEPTDGETPELEPAEEPAPIEPEAEPTDGEPAVETVNVGGREIPTEDLARYARFNEWAEQNPQLWEHLLEVERTGIPAATGEVAHPEGEEWVDPEVRIQQLEGRLSAMEQSQTEGAKAEFMASIEDGIDRFRTKYPDLNDDQMQEVLVELRDLQILPTFRQKFQARPVLATTSALEVAYRNKFFDQARQALEPKPPNIKEARARRAAASAAPTGASAPRVDPLPESPSERLAAMAGEIKEAMEQ